MEALRVENLTLNYDDKIVIEDMNVSISKGKVTVIIGANGCGKSTLLKSIARVLKAKDGNIFIENINIHDLTSKEIARKMAVLPQSPIAPEGLKVNELISYGRFPHKNGFGTLNQEDYEIIEQSLKTAGIEELKDQALENLSGGQRQRAWIAMALCQNTEVLLLDEPTTYLDLSHQLDVLKLLDKLNKEQNATIVMVLHDLNHASRFADEIIAMKNGKIVIQGSSEKVMTKEVLKEVYNIDATLVIDEASKKPLILTYNNL